MFCQYFVYISFNIKIRSLRASGILKSEKLNYKAKCSRNKNTLQFINITDILQQLKESKNFEFLYFFGEDYNMNSLRGNK